MLVTNSNGSDGGRFPWSPDWNGTSQGWRRKDREERTWEGGRGRWRREERDLENRERGWGRWEEGQREQGSLTGRHSR